MGESDLDASRTVEQVEATSSTGVASANSQAGERSTGRATITTAALAVFYLCGLVVALHFGLVALYAGQFGENFFQRVPAVGPVLDEVQDRLFGPTGSLVIGVVIGLVLIIFSEAWRILLPWVPVKKTDAFHLGFGATILLFWLTYLFVLLTTWMYAKGLTEASQNLEIGGELVRAAEEYYIFHLLDEVPLLKIPETLDWEQPATFTDDASRALLLSYRILVILPVIRVAAELLRREREGEKVA
jgi:hypothetical protein